MARMIPTLSAVNIAKAANCVIAGSIGVEDLAGASKCKLADA